MLCSKCQGRCCLTKSAENEMKPNPTTLPPSRNILDGVATLHETHLEMCKKKLHRATLKLDFEKAYDKINWIFLPMITLPPVGGSKDSSKSECETSVQDKVSPHFQTKEGSLRIPHVANPFYHCSLYICWFYI